METRQIGDVWPEIDKKIASGHLPFSAKITCLGDYANQAESGQIIAGALGVSFILIYFLMVLLYNDFVYQLIVLFAIPMSFIGEFLALAVAKSSLRIFTLIGMVVRFDSSMCLTVFIVLCVCMVVDTIKAKISSRERKPFALWQRVRLYFRLS